MLLVHATAVAMQAKLEELRSQQQELQSRRMATTHDAVDVSVWKLVRYLYKS